MRKRHIKGNYLAGGMSVGLFCLLMLALLFPSVRTESYAVDCAPGEEPCTTTMAETAVDLMVASTVSVALQSNVEINAVPKSTGSFTETTSKLTVATNNPSGYAIYMQAGKNQDGKANLVSSDLSNTATISPVSGVVGSSSFSANTWGYSLDGTNYQAVPATTSIIKETATTSYNDSYNLFFGVNVDTNLPAGQYTNSVIVSAVANPMKITSLNQLVYMQDMTSGICINTAENTTKQLIDTRDGKSYWVAKLKDGNCWMTQNLALDLSTDKALTPADSDVSTSWTPRITTNSLSLNASYFDESIPSEYASWNLGEMTLATPLETYSYPGCEGTNNTLKYENGQFKVNLASLCREYGVVDVSGTNWKATFKAQAGNFDNKSYNYVTVDENNQTYDAHYLLGNYYQTNAAIAGSDGNNSICPKGWQLPNGGVNQSGTLEGKPLDQDKSSYKLFLAYGYPNANNYTISNSSSSYNGYYSRTPIINQGKASESNPFSAPMHFTPSGYVYVIDHGVYSIGINSMFWNKTKLNNLLLSSLIGAIYSGPDETPYIYPGTTFDQYQPGYGIRCVAR